MRANVWSQRVAPARRPRNPIGWLLLAIFLLAVAPAGDYAIIDYRMHVTVWSAIRSGS